MPLNTTVTQSPPSIAVIVTGGGGSPTKRRIDVHVSWDERILSFVKTLRKGGFKHDAGSGAARWEKVNMLGSATFKLVLKRKRGKADATFVVACAVDPKTGEFRCAPLNFA